MNKTEKFPALHKLTFSFGVGGETINGKYNQEITFFFLNCLLKFIFFPFLIFHLIYLFLFFGRTTQLVGS